MSQTHKPQPKHTLCLLQLTGLQAALPLLHLARKPPQPPRCRAGIQRAFAGPSWILRCRRRTAVVGTLGVSNACYRHICWQLAGNASTCKLLQQVPP